MGTSREALRVESERVDRLESLVCPPVGEEIDAAPSERFRP
jgi:hypothetical protein